MESKKIYISFIAFLLLIAFSCTEDFVQVDP